MRTFSNVLAALTLIPVILISAGSGLNFLRRVPTRRYAEAGALAIGLMMVGFVAFAAKGPKLGNVPALVYAPLPFLLWAAMRFGPGGLSTSLLSTDEPLPVFILLDISLPKVSGLESCAQLRAIQSSTQFQSSR